MTFVPLRVGVLVSGRGSNLQALIDARTNGRLPIELVAVGSNQPGCEALARAQTAGIPVFACQQRDYADRATMDAAIDAALRAHAPDLVVLAGFMRILAPAMVGGWTGRMINIHPSLLPRYPGLDTHARALAAGDSEHGASVHYVIPALDAGPVLAQVRIALAPGDTPDTVARRLLPREHALLLASLRLLAARRAELAPAGIQYDGGRLAAPLQLDTDDALHTNPAPPAD